MKRCTSADKGYHVWFFVKDGSDIPRYGKVLFDRLWLAGGGYIVLSACGTMLIRTIIDGSVFSAEHLDFIGKPVLEGTGLEYTPPKTRRFKGTVLDTKTLLDLTAEEVAEVDRLKTEAAALMSGESKAKREEWGQSKIAEMVARGESLEVAQASIAAMGDDVTSDLFDAFPLYFADPKLGDVSVSEVLANAWVYDGKAMADPIEGVGYGTTTAIFYANINKGNGKAFINSQAHGGCKYFLNLSSLGIAKEKGTGKKAKFDAMLKATGAPKAANKLSKSNKPTTGKVGGLMTVKKESSTPATGLARAIIEGAPSFECNKNGVILATIDNLCLALENPVFCGWTIGLDNFRDDLMFHLGDGQWQVFTDEHYIDLRRKLPKLGFEQIGRELIRDAVYRRATSNKFDSAQEWLNSLTWDGIPRIKTFNNIYFGAEGTPYTEAVAFYMWTALAGRILEPGVQADMVPILVGDQGLLKSTAIAALVPSHELFCEISFSMDEDKLARLMRGTLVAEVSELRGLGTRDNESIKSFIARRYEKWVPKYKEFKTTYPRRLVLVGTTNKTEVLCDETGERRWLPFNVIRSDREGIKRDRNQLWAEAASLFKVNGVMWEDAENLAKQEHSEFTVTDIWHAPIEHYLGNRAARSPQLPANSLPTIEEIYTSALRKDIGDANKNHEMRIAKVLKNLGYTSKRETLNGLRASYWRKLS